MNKHQKTINSMRAIALDSINKAGQGHIGMAIGAAPITYSLIAQKLNMSQKNPKWINRDRFVLSAGHGSMSQYSIMHFLGLLSVEDMKSHKILHSKTPSHPEIDAFDYVDASTGPLGQGIAMAVGMAISQKYLQGQFNKNDCQLIDHHIFALHGDGCIQEGVALESIQLAGTLKLNKLILIHDFNNVQIDSLSKEVNDVNLVDYFKSQNFNIFVVEEPTFENITNTIEKAKHSTKPSYIQVHTKIAYGTPMEGTPSGHNGVLNEKKTIEFKTKLELTNFEPFVYDRDVYEHGKELMEEKEKEYEKWLDIEKSYKEKYLNLYEELMDIYDCKKTFSVLDVIFEEKDVATRNYIVPLMKKLESFKGIVGGSADLAGATKVKFTKELIDGGKNIKYGIREFAMTAINNGIYLHSGLRTIDSTFLAFADYAKAGYRLGAIQKIPAIHIFTHDSYQVGGDGPTHQPFDQLGMLRLIEGMKVIRVADGEEMRGAFEYALQSKETQVAIIGCRQPIKSFNKVEGMIPVAYQVKTHDEFDVSILASGSEVSLAYEVANELENKGIKAQVISVPIVQDLVENKELIENLKINQKPIYAIEASNDNIWYKLSMYNKFDGFFASGYGYSADGSIVYQEKGFKTINLVKKIQKFLS